MALLIPRGHRFSPTDEEMIEYFLKPKIHGFHVPSIFFNEMDVYASEPWNLGVAFQLGPKRNEAFFFTPRHPSSRSGKGSRAKRTAGDGYWHGESSDTKILIGSQVVGYKTSFAFKKRDGTNCSPDNQWIMHEYLLHDDNSTSRFQPLALCRIYKKPNGGKRLNMAMPPPPPPPCRSLQPSTAAPASMNDSDLL